MRMGVNYYFLMLAGAGCVSRLTDSLNCDELLNGVAKRTKYSFHVHNGCVDEAGGFGWGSIVVVHDVCGIQNDELGKPANGCIEKYVKKTEFGFATERKALIYSAVIVTPKSHRSPLNL